MTLTGINTDNGFLYKPGLTASGTPEKAAFDAGLDRIDTRLGKEIWVGDPNYGTTLQEAITAIGSAVVRLKIPTGSITISSRLHIPGNITMDPMPGAVLTSALGTITCTDISNATALVVSASNHGLQVGDPVFFSGFAQTDWIALNGEIGFVTVANTNDFTVNLNSSAWMDYAAGSNPAALIQSPNLIVKGGIIYSGRQCFGSTSVVQVRGVDNIQAAWWGLDPTRTTDCKASMDAAFKSAHASQTKLVFSSGDFLIASTVTALCAWEGQGMQHTRFWTSISDGSPTFDVVPSALALQEYGGYYINPEAKEFSIFGTASAPARNNTIGINFGLQSDRQYAVLNVRGQQLTTAVSSITWVGRIILYTNRCEQSIVCSSIDFNAMQIWLDAEENYGNPVTISGGSAITIDGCIEGFVGDNLTGITLNNCNGVKIRSYFETAAGPTNLTFVNIGPETLCTGVELLPGNTNTDGLGVANGQIIINKVKGCMVGGSINCPVIINDNESIGVQVQTPVTDNGWVRYSHSAARYQDPGGVENYFPNPHFRYALRGWKTLTKNNVNCDVLTTSQSSNDLHGGGIVLYEPTSSNNYVQIDLPDIVTATLKGEGRFISIACLIRVPATATFTTDTNPLAPMVLLNVDGEDQGYDAGPITRAQGATQELWYQVNSYAWVPSTTTTVGVRIYLNNSANNVSGDEIVVVSNMVISTGVINMTDMINGRWRQAPEAGYGIGVNWVMPMTATPTDPNQSYLQGDRGFNTAPAEAGSSPNKYVVEGWACTVAGPGGTATFLAQRTLTGN